MADPQRPRTTSDRQKLEDEVRQLRERLDALQTQLREPEEIVRAIRGGEVDALVVSDPEGERIYSLRTADVLYRAMVEEMKDGAVTLDSSGMIVYCNAYFAQLVKADRASLVGTRVFRFASEESRPFFAALAEPSPSATRRQELTLRASDGAVVPVLATMNRIQMDAQEVSCLIVSNLTDQKRQEELLLESRRKDEFLAMLAHELRNPLAPIRYAAETLRARDLEPARVAWALDVIGRQVTQLTHLVDDLLDVSRITRGKINLQLEPLELDGVVARAVEGALSLVEARRQELIVSQPGSKLRVRADGTRLAQIVSNLLNNASKFTPQGGRIWLNVEQHGQWAHLIVKDTGVGIAPELLPRVFDLFTQADASQGRAQGGLGIGLTLVRSLVELHGGTVEAFSEGANRGSELVVRLPLLTEAPQQPEARPGAGAAPVPRGPARRILIVDDNLDVAESLARWLADDGHDVRIAPSGEEALTQAPAFRPHLVLVDVGLPGISGHETARKLRRMPELQGTALIAVTGYGREEDRQASLLAGFDQHWVKPLDLAALSSFLADLRGNVEPPGARLPGRPRPPTPA